MAYGRNINNSRNRNSWGPMSIPSSGGGFGGSYKLDPEEELAEECTERMMNAQLKQLDPLKEDLADWLNKTLGINYINRENFLRELDNGVVLCSLAQIICDRAKCAMESGYIKGPLPSAREKWFKKAMSGSFFSRDNMENFIKFCRSLGVHENLLFESDDLVLHNQPRNVIICLLEVSRIATRFGVEAPVLVQLEKEIAEEERNNSADSGLSSLLSWQFQVSPPKIEHDGIKMRHSSSASAISTATFTWNTEPHLVLLPGIQPLNVIGPGGDAHNSSLPSQIITPSAGASDGVPSDNTEDEWSRGSGEDPDLDIDTCSTTTPSKGPGGDATSELDKKVQLAARLMQRNCKCLNGKCSKLRVQKVGEGKYNIAGKNVFVRLLKGRHMMVRVGGGWDTLDHFLLRHDPCQVKVVSRDSPDRPASASKFLHIRAKYRSPPPREPVIR